MFSSLKYIEARGENNDSTIIALHGTGGDEDELIPLAQQLGHGAAIISPRGKVKEGKWNRFFARLPSGVFDEKDVFRRSQYLANVVLDVANQYKRPLNHPVALGYSNGANIAAATLPWRPEAFSQLILMRPMLPLRPPDSLDLDGKEVLILRGTQDTVIPNRSTDQLIEVLQSSGAQVDVHEIEAGHELTSKDLQIASQWLAGTVKPHFVA